MNKLKNIKKNILFVFLALFSSCSCLDKKQEIISMNDFNSIIEGKFKDTQDVINVFPKSVDDVTNRVNLLTSIVKDELQKVLDIKPEERTFENTPLALDRLEAKFAVGANAIEIFEMITPDEKMLKACHDAALKLNAFSVETFLNPDIYKAFKEYVDGNMKNEQLDEEKKYFIQDTMQDFKRLGFDLPENKFQEVKELKKEISALGLKFDSNINRDNSFIEVEEKDLKGLKPDFINSLKKSDSGRIILTCKGPTFVEVMQNCEMPKTRKDLYFKFMNRAYPQNIEILNKLIEKRDELARLIGFKSYAELDLDDQMVKNTTRARQFLSELVEKTMKKADKEYAKIKQDLPEGITLDENQKISPWDHAFIKERYKEKKLNIDERKIAEYFPVDNTLKEIFDIYQEFLGLEFKPVQINGVWHKDVKAVQVFDKKTGENRGVLFLDLYPRKNKYSHACMAEVVCTTKIKNKDTGKQDFVPAVITVIANFPKATKEKPALFKYDDVQTFFHEFGHAMHGFLGRTQMASFSGTNVKRDFVEMPSQMFEEWMWNKDILKKVSKHYKTGESLPDDLIDRMIDLKVFDSGAFVTRQVVLSLVALDYFSPGAKKDTGDIYKKVYENYIQHVRFEPDTHMWAAWGHLVGYGAKYYGYMWSRVFSLDMFEKIKKAGLLNVEMGQELINKVLGKGGSADPDVLLKDFLGRKPNQDAFLKEYGII